MSELRPSNVLEQLAGYVLDDLLPQAAAEVEQILHNEPSLMLEVKRLQEAFALLPYALSEVKPLSIFVRRF